MNPGTGVNGNRRFLFVTTINTTVVDMVGFVLEGRCWRQEFSGERVEDMKAVVLEKFGGPEVLEVREVPTPEPGAEEVRIRVAATALNRADLLEREGRYPPPGRPPVFQIPGLEVSGTVDQVGERVTTFTPGDRVMALLPGGGYAEYAISPERLTMAVPDRLTLSDAAAIPEAFLTAFDALYLQGGGRASSRVLVHAGASGVGSAAIQLAHHTRMRVMATAGSEVKLQAASAFGADRVVNYRESAFYAAVQEWTGGQGVDLILDFVGQSYLQDNLRSLAPDGRLVLIGTLSGSQAGIDLGLVLGKRIRIQGTALRSRPLERKMALVQQFVREAGPLLAEGVITPVIDRHMPLADIQAAHEYMALNQNIGKIVVDVNRSL